MKKRYTIEQVLEAVKAGGYPQGRFHAIEWVGDNEFEGEIKDACAIGAAALNLGVSPQGLLDSLMDITPRKNSHYTLTGFIVELNDEKELAFLDIAAQAFVRFKQKLKTEVEVEEQDYSKVTNYKGMIY